MRHVLVGVVLSVAAAMASLAAEGAPARSDNVEVRLVSDAASIAPGQTFHVGLHKTIAPTWHTYWINAGDAGEATEITWGLPDGLSAGSIIWPTPKVYTLGGVVTNYIFEDELLLNTEFRADETLQPGQTLRIDAELYWQECAEICIPVDNVNVSLELPVVAAGAQTRDPAWAERVDAALAAAPADLGVTAGLSRSEAGVVLSVADEALLAPAIAQGAVRDPYFFPLDDRAIDHNAAQPAAFGARGLALTLTPGPALRDDLPTIQGVLAFEERRDGGWARRSVQLTASAQAVDIGAAAGGAARPDGAASGGGLNATTIIGALVGAFVGGLILNLMPCVFPVLSIKALGFANKAHSDAGEIRAHGLMFLFGVLSTFAVLGGGLMALKAAGVGVGWGSQLQSPLAVAALAVLMFAIGLNLMGFFEVGTSLQSVGGGLADKGGAAGAFFTGVLAVAVAAPCTAPFMAGALGFAFAQPAYVAMPVFLALGLGLAAPFVALSLAPGLLRYLPKPGPWMETFKQVLAFPMFLTAIWLVWTLAIQTGAAGVAGVLVAMTGVAFTVWALRAAQGGGKTVARVAAAAGVAVTLAATGAAGAVSFTGADDGARSGARSGASGPAIVAEDAWSPDRVAALQAEGRGVFVDFTAAWCITCQVNKRTTLTQASVREVFAAHDVVFLTADWTNRDPVIAETLEQHGRAGVPLYLFYSGDGDVEVLPQLLTPQIVINAVERTLSEQAS